MDALHTEELGLTTATDGAIMERAVEDGRTCVTLDRDFHRLLAQSNATAPSVIRLRFQFLRPQSTTSLILAILRQAGPQLAGGLAVTATPRGTRIRKLPFRPSA
jgi:predicted nuclease of predicted toxin-antitoxin system